MRQLQVYNRYHRCSVVVVYLCSDCAALAHFVAENVLQVVVEQLEVELKRAVQLEHSVVVQRCEVLDKLRGRVGVGTLRETDVGRTHNVPEQVVRVLE